MSSQGNYIVKKLTHETSLRPSNFCMEVTLWVVKMLIYEIKFFKSAY